MFRNGIDFSNSDITVANAKKVLTEMKVRCSLYDSQHADGRISLIRIRSCKS